jgi:hypothetical protein
LKRFVIKDLEIFWPSERNPITMADRMAGQAAALPEKPLMMAGLQGKLW